MFQNLSSNEEEYMHEDKNIKMSIKNLFSSKENKNVPTAPNPNLIKVPITVKTNIIPTGFLLL